MLGTRLPANTVQGMMDLCCQMLLDDGDASTFYSQRVFDLFPQLATTNSGWSTHTAQANSVFGSTINSGSTNNSDYIEWTVYLDAGNYKLLVEHETSTDRGKADLAVDGGSVVSTMDQYSASATRNVLHTSSEFTVTEGSHTIRLTKNGKHASSSAYTLSAQHCQLIKQDATSALTSVANVPHVINVSPYIYASSAAMVNSPNTSAMFGSFIYSDGNQNFYSEYSFWAPAGNFTLNLLYVKNSNAGIMTVTVNGGGSLGTIDGYAALAYNNLSSTITGTFATSGVQTIRFTMATKNASSTAYFSFFQYIQILMTSISEPLAADMAPQCCNLWLSQAYSHTNWNTITPSLQYVHYHNIVSTGAQNALIHFENVVLAPGTYTFTIVSNKYNDMGKYHLLVDGVDVGNVDAYAASISYNSQLVIAGIALSGYSPHTVELKMASKHASSSSYIARANFVRAIRTGA